MDRQLLSRATDSSEAPTPGYMYLDIAKNAASNPAVCGEVAKYLTNRLQKNNPNIKFKCLKIISKTCVSPYVRGGQFKRCLSQDPSSMACIKEAIQFRGPPDPVRGDAPYEKVRVAAREALDAVYSDTPADTGSGVGAAPFATSISPSYGGGGGGGGGVGSGMSMAAGAGGGPRRMEGIGNPMFSDPRLEPQKPSLANMTAKDVLNEARETVIGMIKDPLARRADLPMSGQSRGNPNMGSYGGPQGNIGSSYGPPPGRSELMQQTGGAWTMASNRGPAAVPPPPNFQNDSAYYKARDSGGNNSFAWAQQQQQQQQQTHHQPHQHQPQSMSTSGGVGGSWASAAASAPPPPPAISQPAYNATPSISVTGGAGAMTSNVQIGGGGTAISDGSYEKQLVMELCPPGGMKAEPPPDKLNQFARSVSNLNPDLVCPVLLDCLEEGSPWIIRAKALWVIESCLKHGQKPGAPSNAYTDFFHACSGEIAPLVNHNRSQIREPAKRVVALLGVSPPPSGSAAAPPAVAPPAAAPPAPVPNLLDFDDSPAPAVAPPAPTSSSAPDTTNASLFGGLSMAGSGSTSAPPPTAPTTAPPPPPPTTTTTAHDDDNLLDGFGQTSSAVVQPSNADLFGDMMVKSTTTQSSDPGPTPVPAPAPAPAPASTTTINTATTNISSMFDNMSVLSEEATAATAPAPAPAGSAFGFINQSSSTDSGTEKKTDAPTSNQSTANISSSSGRDSFDPLKNVTPNAQRQMMQVSPEQMQAMLYQQMLMQQQQQMSQMMAMGGGTGVGVGAMNQAARMQQMQQMRMMQQGQMMQQQQQQRPARAEDKKFNFVQDAMSMEKKK